MAGTENEKINLDGISFFLTNLCMAVRGVATVIRDVLQRVHISESMYDMHHACPTFSSVRHALSVVTSVGAVVLRDEKRRTLLEALHRDTRGSRFVASRHATGNTTPRVDWATDRVGHPPLPAETLNTAWSCTNQIARSLLEKTKTLSVKRDRTNYLTLPSRRCRKRSWDLRPTDRCDT